MITKISFIIAIILFGGGITAKAGQTEFCLAVKTGSKEINKIIYDAFKNGNGVPACIKFVQIGNIDTVGLFEVYFRETKDPIPQSFYTDAGYDINWHTEWLSPIKYTGIKAENIPYIKILKSINAVWGIRIIAEGMNQPIIFERPLKWGAAIREMPMDMALGSLSNNLSHLMRSIIIAHPNLCEIVNKKQ